MREGEREGEEREGRKRKQTGRRVERKLRGGGWGVMMSGYHGARMGDRKGRSK